MELHKHKEISLSLLCVVCDRDRGDKVLRVLEGQKAFFNLATLGKGTANSRILNYLGLGNSDKSMFFSIMPTPIAKETIQKLDGALQLDKPGHGIAFLTNVHEGCYHIPVEFTGKDTGEKDMEQTSTHDLIMVVLNRGYTEEVMDVARGAGATGGTVLHARGCGLAGAEKFFGVTIQPEKEMIMIVAPGDTSCAIMGAIGEKAGPGTDSSAISFSLPLNGVVGLGNAQKA